MKEALFPDLKILETELFDLHQDCEVPIPGFFILASKRNIKSIADFTDAEAAEFTKILRNTRSAMKQHGITEVYLFQNEDSDHEFHVWIFPRHDWMEQFGRKIQSVRPIMNYAKEHLVSEQNLEEVRTTVEHIRECMH